MNRKPGAGSAKVAVQRFARGSFQADDDIVAVEEPLQISLLWPGGERAIAVTMRTPGDDEELALGFLFGEGIIRARTRVLDVDTSSAQPGGSIVRVQLDHQPAFDELDVERNFYMTSSCGICGKASIDAIQARAEYAVGDSAFEVMPEVLNALPQQLTARQNLFAGTGSIHAAALFDTQGITGRVYEDVGRHNALDKLIGNAVRAQAVPLHDTGIMVSGRASFELVQKARMAGAPLLAAVGAPSSLAIDLAWESGITLVGFLRDDRFNVYTVPSRVTGLS